MIVDALENARRYTCLGERFAAAFDFLRRPHVARLEPPGDGSQQRLIEPVLGDAVYATIQRYRPRMKSQAFWEAHRIYADVQCVVEGAEILGCAPMQVMRQTQPYDAERDYVVVEPMRGEECCNFITLRPGMFAIFLPSDAHMSGLESGETSGTVKKIVVKVRM